MKCASFVVAIVLPCAISQADTQDRLDHGLLIADMSVTNPGITTKHLIKIGVSSQVHGSFGCMPNSYTLIPLADYAVSFFLLDPETIIPADPKIVIEPNGSARFTIGIHPYAGHWSIVKECGPWNVDVVVFAIFDDGTKISTQTENITDKEFYAFAAKGMSQPQIKAALSHRLATLRLQALRALDDAAFSAAEERRLLRAALRDTDENVAASAVEHVKKHAYKDLGPDLVMLLNGLPAKAPRLFELYETLGVIGETTAIEPLMARLEAGTGERLDDWALEQALVQIDVHRSLKARLLTLVKKRSSLIAQDADKESIERYTDLIRMLVMYQDVAAFPTIAQALHEGRIRYEVLQASRDILDNPDPAFLKEIIPIWRAMLRDEHDYIRDAAFGAMARIPVSMKNELPVSFISSALERVAAVDGATAACRFGYKKFTKRICEIWRGWGKENWAKALDTCVSEQALCLR